jgi:hypothetical protein
VRNRALVLVAALAAALSGLLVAFGAATPAFAGSGSSQAAPFPVGNLLSYANSDFEGSANFIAVTNVGTISDSAAAAEHGNDSLKFTSASAGSTVLKLQEGSSATQIDVTGSDTYTLAAGSSSPQPTAVRVSPSGWACTTRAAPGSAGLTPQRWPSAP